MVSIIWQHHLVNVDKCGDVKGMDTYSDIFECWFFGLFDLKSNLHQDASRSSCVTNWWS